MENNSLSMTQVFAVTSVENYMLAFSDNPGDYFKIITHLIDKHKITEHKKWMTYLYELFLRKGTPEYIEEFAKKYKYSFESENN